MFATAKAASSERIAISDRMHLFFGSFPRTQTKLKFF
jgi:hypothetical protein